MVFVCLKSLIFPLPEKPSILWLRIGSFWTSKDVKDIQNNFRFLKNVNILSNMRKKAAKKMWKKDAKKGSSDSQVTISKQYFAIFFSPFQAKNYPTHYGFCDQKIYWTSLFQSWFLFPLLLSKYRVNFIGTYLV